MSNERVGGLTLRGARAEFVRVAKRELERLERLPADERADAYKEAFGNGAVRGLAGLPTQAPTWVKSRTVDFEYLVNNPAPPRDQLRVEYTLELPDSVLLLQRADPSEFGASELYQRRRSDTVVYWVGVKKTRVIGTRRRLRVGRGKRSAAGTGRSIPQAPRVGKEYVLRGQEGETVAVRVTGYDVKRRVLWTRPV